MSAGRFKPLINFQINTWGFLNKSFILVAWWPYKKQIGKSKINQLFDDENNFKKGDFKIFILNSASGLRSKAGEAGTGAKLLSHYSSS